MDNQPLAFYEYLDQIVNLELKAKRVLQGATQIRYTAARKLCGPPLSRIAADLILRLPPSSLIFISTGAGNPTTLPKGETDGPSGVAFLTRVLNALSHPVCVVSESHFLPAIMASLAAVNILITKNSLGPHDPVSTFASPFPLGPDEADAHVRRLLDQHPNASVAIFIEKPGPNTAGVFHSASKNFLEGDPHDGLMPLDYFVWDAIGKHRTFVIDTGFNSETAAQRKREFLRCPSEGLKSLGVEPHKVRDVILTHLHYDHVGNFDLFPNAIFHLQDREMAYATGRLMCHRRLREAFDPEHIVGVVRQVYRDQVAFHDGDSEIVPGISVHHIGGHTLGLQAVRVNTARGWVVLASDVSHFYANFEQKRAFPNVVRVEEMLEGHLRLRQLAASPKHIIPGHDPEVMRRYRPPSPELISVCVRLDVDPIEITTEREVPSEIVGAHQHS